MENMSALAMGFRRFKRLEAHAVEQECFKGEWLFFFKGTALLHNEGSYSIYIPAHSSQTIHFYGPGSRLIHLR